MREPSFVKCLNAVSMAATINSGVPMNMNGYSRASFQTVWTGDGVGVMNFLVSNQPDAVLNGVVDLTKFKQLVNPAAFAAQDPAGTAGGGYYALADLACAFLLPVYTRSSAGTGVLTVHGAAS